MVRSREPEKEYNKNLDILTTETVANKLYTTCRISIAFSLLTPTLIPVELWIPLSYSWSGLCELLDPFSSS